jgi:lysophospholipase L1-like esterase
MPGMLFTIVALFICKIFVLCNVNAWANHLTLVDLVGNGGILAFGDSNTRGLTSERGESASYSAFFHKMLKAKHKGINCAVTNKGFSGNTTEDLYHRLPLLLSNQGVTHPRLIVILAGTNDLILLGHGVRRRTANETISNLIKMHQIVQQHGASVKQLILSYAVSIPQIKSGSIADSQRASINAALYAYSKRCSPMVRYLDIGPHFDLPNNEHRQLWYEDGVHFSARGHYRLAELLYRDMERWVATLSPAQLRAVPSSPCW